MTRTDSRQIVLQAMLAAGQATKARLVLRGAVQAAETDPLSLLLAAKAAIALGGEAFAEGVALTRCASRGCKSGAASVISVAI